MKALDGTILKPYPGNFVHGIDLNNGYPCWNLSLSGRLYSPDFVAAVDRGVFECHKSIRDTDIESIERGHMPHGAYTPRGLWFIQAAHQIRAGEYSRWSATSCSHFSDKEAEHISKMGAVEVAFEKRRREVAPQAASRLSCLYVADDNEHGRSHLKRMFGYGIHILRVTIPLAICVTKCDIHWFDAYWAELNPDYIDKLDMGDVGRN